MKSIFLNNLISKYVINEESFKEISDEIDQSSEIMAKAIKENRRIIFTGVGSIADLIQGMIYDININFKIQKDNFASMKAGQSYKDLKDEWTSLSALPSTSILELQEMDLKSSDVVIGITSSGTTTYTINALKYAEDLGCETILITNANKSKIDIKVTTLLNLELEYTINNLRSFEGTTTIKILLDILILDSLVKSGRIWENELIYVEANSSSTFDDSIRVLMNTTEVPNKDIATEVLKLADNKVYYAILMYRYGKTLEESKELIIKHNYDFKEIVESIDK